VNNRNKTVEEEEYFRLTLKHHNWPTITP
jgi:hypothetical protein